MVCVIGRKEKQKKRKEKKTMDDVANRADGKALLHGNLVGPVQAKQANAIMVRMLRGVKNEN